MNLAPPRNPCRGYGCLCAICTAESALNEAARLWKEAAKDGAVPKAAEHAAALAKAERCVQDLSWNIINHQGWTERDTLRFAATTFALLTARARVPAEERAALAV